MKILKFRYIIVFLLALSFYPLVINAVNIKDSLTHSDASHICEQYIRKEKACKDAGCKFLESGVCVAPNCDSDDITFSSCNTYSYCTTTSVLRTKTNQCLEKVSYNHNGMKCYPYDDYGEKNPNYDPTGCSYGDYNPVKLAYGGTSSESLCQLLYAMPDDQKIGETVAQAYCENKIPNADHNSLSNCIKTNSNLTVSSLRSEKCGVNNCTGKNRVPYKDTNGSTGQKVNGCTCAFGYKPDANNTLNCVKGTGSGSSSCVNVSSFVESYSVNNVCTGDNNCSLADCSGNGDANPFDKSNGSKFDTGISYIKTKDGNKSYNQAWRYRGTCNGKNTDVFCIDPGAKYHDNNAGYTCKSSMNEDSDIDAGYIKIYQSALQTYAAMYADGTQELTDDQYQGIHFAFRFWTFYKNMDRYNGEDSADNPDITEDNSIYAYTNSEISHGFNGTSLRLAGKASNDAYFVVKPGINGYEYGKSAQMSDAGYRDAVQFFRDAVNDGNIWVNPLKFSLVSIDKNNHTAKVSLDNIQLLRDSRFLDGSGNPKFNFVRNIYCTGGCSVIGLDPNTDYLRNGTNSVTFTVKYSGSSFTVGVYYYDKRDGKNVILATAGQPTEYQRLVFVTSALAGSSTREFRIEKTFDYNDKMPCQISNGRFYDRDGNLLVSDNNGKDYEKYVMSGQCCEPYVVNNENGDHDTYCNILKSRGVDKSDSDFYTLACNSQYKDKWAKNGCNPLCSPNNTNPEGGNCYKLEGDTVTISDLTDPTDMGLPSSYYSSDNYCLKCVGNNGRTVDNGGTSYSHQFYTSNNYCDIYCIEEYKFKVPKGLTTNGGTAKYGRYLTLEVPSTATKICYTDTQKPIDYEQFKKDVNAKKNEVIDAINVLNKYITAYNEAKNNMDKFTESSGDVCKTTKEETGPTCPAGTTYGTNKCKTSCEECTAANENGCIDSICTDPTGTGITYSTVNCDGNPTPKSYSYTSSNGVSASSGGSCSECSANNGSKQAVVDAFKKYQDDQKAVVKALIDEYDTIFAHYNKCYTFDTGSCIGSNQNNNPYIEYSYAEEYYMQLIGSNNKLQGEWATQTRERIYHDTLNTDKCTYGDRGIDANGSNAGTYSNDNYKKFVASGDSYVLDSDANSFKVLVNKYVYLKETKGATLKPVSTWYTVTGNGTATLNANEKNANYLGRVLPISRVCKPGQNTFNYELKFMNIGQDPDSCQMGRLNKVIKSLNDPTETDNYVCNYTVSDKECKPCEETYYVRPISLSDVFPKSGKGIEERSKEADGADYRSDVSIKQSKLYNERSAAPNWTTAKGKETQKRVEAAAESIYGDNNKYLEYSYTITPAGMKQIREYNKDKKYTDFEELKCTNHDCTSPFLDKIANNELGSGVKQNKRNAKHERFTDGSIWK
ncbi:MAG: hypothetical protein J5892_02530 [Bacilli bacterium]|nr:hypothetical protein [Bacilli bacterium]